MRRDVGFLQLLLMLLLHHTKGDDSFKDVCTSASQTPFTLSLSSLSLSTLHLCHRMRCFRFSQRLFFLNRGNMQNIKKKPKAPFWFSSWGWCWCCWWWWRWWKMKCQPKYRSNGILGMKNERICESCTKKKEDIEQVL